MQKKFLRAISQEEICTRYCTSRYHCLLEPDDGNVRYINCSHVEGAFDTNTMVSFNIHDVSFAVTCKLIELILFYLISIYIKQRLYHHFDRPPPLPDFSLRLTTGDVSVRIETSGEQRPNRPHRSQKRGYNDAAEYVSLNTSALSVEEFTSTQQFSRRSLDPRSPAGRSCALLDRVGHPRSFRTSGTKEMHIALLPGECLSTST